MFNIIDQHKGNFSAGSNEIMLALNETKSSSILTTTSDGQKIDCAKVCPCGVPVIPVPDQWLEVMVTGGFKVWHIIFIIIAFVISIVVVYCCFHRCRIPRTKQEIEADLMRTNLTQKFGDYLQEFPNEPTTFLEAVKKVQELEEKWANERDDSGAKKRMGWLKLRGKERQADKVSGDPTVSTGKEADAAEPTQSASDQQGTTTIENESKTQPVAADADDAAKKRDVEPSADSKATKRTGAEQQSGEDNKAKQLSSHKNSTGKKEPKPKEAVHAIGKEKSDSQSSKPGPILVKAQKVKGDKGIERQTTKHNTEPEPPGASAPKLNPTGEHDHSNPASGHNQKPKVRRKRDKPNLSRTKATHVVGSHNESLEISSNVLSLPVANVHRRLHEPHHHAHHQDPEQHAEAKNATASLTTSGERTSTTAKRKLQQSSGRTRKQTATRGDSTFIQILTDDLSPS